MGAENHDRFLDLRKGKHYGNLSDGESAEYRTLSIMYSDTQRLLMPEDVRKAKDREHSKKWREANRGRYRELCRLFYKRHKTRRLAACSAYARKRWLTDPVFRLGRRIQSRIKMAIRTRGKSPHTAELLGCTIETAMRHIESLFQEGMHWGNHSLRGWHLDHIRPVASFDLTDEAQLRACFHYTNLQPLWAKDNLHKGAKYPMTQTTKAKG